MNARDGIYPEIAEVDRIVTRARTAQAVYEKKGCQALYDKAALAAGWAIMEPTRNRALAEIAVETTGLGNVPDKITKNHRKTLGLLRDIAKVKTYGVINNDPATGMTEIARPIGVIGAVVPSTNPAATPANNIINALKGGNSIVVAPSPKGVASCEMLIGYIHAEFDKLGLDRNLVQMIPAPGSKAKTQRLMESVDRVICTGSQNNVHRAQSCGTPAVAVGAGNVTVIVDESADLQAAAAKITASKCFDNATSCSSENALVLVDAIYDAFVAAMAAEGGALVPHSEASGIIARLWPDGHLNRSAIAQDADKMLEALGMAGKVPEGTKFLAVETDGIGPDHPLSGEKLSRVLALYRAADFEEAKVIATRILEHQGAGHSVGIHTKHDIRAVGLGRDLPTCRVIVNQAHTFATGGSFSNGLPFSLSMGCGSWGGNAIDTNLHWRHFVQTTKIVRETPPLEPGLEEIFSDYWSEVGQ
ncbi:MULTISPECIES: aldehyde dehydrogenase family protein [unclassified Ruegeria]|uniref:acylating sulfoacetaldehyde dehydrogenase n=1 Tax=unclassified Ruegeria TaxID=2625375 RepID=UPI001AE3B6F6|nr:MULTISPECIES: aldehyde dehydrogenase family protein [unclassified Ruegeria]